MEQTTQYIAFSANGRKNAHLEGLGIYIYVHSHSLRGCETLAPALDKRAPLPQTLVRCRQPLTKGRHGLSSRQRRGPALLKAKGGR